MRNVRSRELKFQSANFCELLLGEIPTNPAEIFWFKLGACLIIRGFRADTTKIYLFDAVFGKVNFVGLAIGVPVEFSILVVHSRTIGPSMDVFLGKIIQSYPERFSVTLLHEHFDEILKNGHKRGL